VERDQQLRQGERVPPTLDLDFNRHRSLALLGGPRRFLDVAHRCVTVARCRCPPVRAQTSATRAIKSQRPSTVSYNEASFVRRASSFPSTRPFRYAVIAPSVGSFDLISRRRRAARVVDPIGAHGATSPYQSHLGWVILQAGKEVKIGALRDIHERCGGVERRPVIDHGWTWKEATRLETAEATPDPTSPAQALSVTSPASSHFCRRRQRRRRISLERRSARHRCRAGREQPRVRQARESRRSSRDSVGRERRSLWRT
jgi:hypothetical protein